MTSTAGYVNEIEGLMIEMIREYYKPNMNAGMKQPRKPEVKCGGRV